MTVEIVELVNGPLRFTANAAGEGPLVLMLHGFPDSKATFNTQLPALAVAGFRAVAVAMRGYEPSSQPSDGDYHAIRLAEDVVAWLDALGCARAHLVGHDWGANAAYAAASFAPERFASLTTIAVPHPVRFAEAYAVDAEQQARSGYILEFLTPGFEEQILAGDCAYLERLWWNWSPGWDVSDGLLLAMKSAFAQPGVAHAALEYYRQGFDTATPAAQAGAALFSTPVIVPTLGICGADDACISADIFCEAMRADDFPTALRVERVAGAGHFVHAERPDAVNALLLDWFKSHPA